MNSQLKQFFKPALVAGLVLAFAGAFSVAPQAGELSKDQMVKALAKKKSSKTRSIIATDDAGGASEVQKAINSVSGRISREIVVEERKQIAKAVSDHKLPAIDLTIPFEYDSAAISPKAVPTLVKLGQVLQDPSLHGASFLVGGHTDASGSAEYNIKLSQRRAQAVRDFLVETFGLSSDKLVAVGFGEIQLKNPGYPEASENRRVQLVNVSQ